MKEENRIKLRFSILTVILLFLTAFTLPASNRSTCPAFGTKSMDTISRTQSSAWAFGVGVRTVQLKVFMRLTSPVPFRSEHRTLNTEHFLFTITQPGAITTFTYDPAGRILTQTAKDTDGTILIQDTFTYDDAGNIQHKTETRGDQTWDIDYEYTTDHRLSGYTITSSQVTNHESQVTVVEYDYDSAGNRTSSQVTDHESQITVVTYTYNNFNQLVSSTTKAPDGTETTTTYEYDQGGRLTTEHAETAEGEEVRTYGYNGFGYMVSVISDTPNAHSESAYTYSYDGKRISKYLNGTLYDYTYTGSNLLETYADTAGRIVKYTYGHALISQSNALGDSQSTITDYQNSVIATLTPTPTLYAYSPFGKVRYQSNSDTSQGLGWLGRQFDTETGNNYLINRYYNADRGSFLSPDRYQYVNNATPFTWNLYQYGYANPLVNVDPEGTQMVGADSNFRLKQAMDKIHYEHLMEEFAGTGVTDPEFFIYENEESGYKYLGNGQFGYNPRRVSDLYKYGGKLGDYIVHDVYTVKEGKLTLAKKKVPVQYLGSGQLDVDVEFYALAIGSFQPVRLALREGGIGAATRRMLSESIDNIAGLPATDVARGATKLANPSFWRAFNRDLLQSESTETSDFFSKFLHDERGFARIGRQPKYQIRAEILELSEKNITDSGITVLGHWDGDTGGYIGKARRIGASSR